MNKPFPEVHDCYEIGGCTFLGFWAKGHWERNDFDAGLLRGHGPEGVAKSGKECKRYRHTYARVVGDWSEGYHQSAVKIDVKPGKGAFPVTTLEP